MKALLSNTEFGKWLAQSKQNFKGYEDGNFSSYEAFKYNLRNKYDDFLSQPLQLGFFIPCDLDGNILAEPKESTLDDSFFSMQVGYNDEQKYQQARERVLFEGFAEDAAKHHISQGRTIEYLANFNTVRLTESAIKQIF